MLGRVGSWAVSVLLCGAPPALSEVIEMEGCKVRVDQETFRLTAETPAGSLLLSDGIDDKTGLSLTVKREGNRLRVRISSSAEQEIHWPKTGRGAEALIYPLSEGLYVPVADLFWKDQLSGKCHSTQGTLSVPLWASVFAEKSVTYFLPEDLGSEVCSEEKEGKLVNYLSHAFRRRDGLFDLEVMIAITDKAPLAPAMEYRGWLEEHQLRATFEQKRKWLPHVDRLFGASHVYLWGDGNSSAAIDDLSHLGFGRLLLVYDPDFLKGDQARELIQKAEGLDFLIGPYDSYDNLQDPDRADSVASLWDDWLWKHGAIVNEGGDRRTGFAGRGYELSSEALRAYEPSKHYLERRLEAFLSQGISSYFLDCDGYGELFDDFDEAHPMNPGRDRENRLARMDRISGRAGLVLGTETAAGWSHRVIHFSHGTHTLLPKLFSTS
jgi:Glycosyl hydrolases related to GH101 family, GH129